MAYNLRSKKARTPAPLYSEISSGESSSSGDSSDEEVPFLQNDNSDNHGDDINNNLTGIAWHDSDNFPRRHGFNGRSGIKADLDESSSALRIFSELFPEALFERIASETNRYEQQHPSRHYTHARNWTDVTTDELRVFFALMMLMGHIQKPSLSSYWSTDDMMNTPFFHQTMPRDRYVHILRNLHFTNNEEADGDDRLYKVRPVVDELVSNFKTAYIPTQKISTDESLWKFKGRLIFRQYNPSKRARFGIKVYRTCQSTGIASGYTWNFKIYTGQDKSDIPASAQVVMDLNSELLGQGYTLYLDNWYSSPTLSSGLFALIVKDTLKIRKQFA